MDFLRSTSLRVSLIAAALLLSTSIAAAAPFDVNVGQMFIVYTMDTGGGPGTLLNGGMADFAQNYVVTLYLDGLGGSYPPLAPMTATSAPSAGQFLPGFNPQNEYFIIGWVNADTAFNASPPPMFNPEDHLILGGPVAGDLNAPSPNDQQDIVDGLRTLGSDPMFLGMNGVLVESADDFWGRFADGMMAARALGAEILEATGEGEVGANFGILDPDGNNALIDQEISGFSGDALGMIGGSLGLLGKLNIVEFTSTDGTTQTFIPEPGIGALMLLAAAGIALRRRRRAA